MTERVINPLLTPSSLPFALPDYQRITDAHVREALEVGLAEQLAELRAISESTEEPTVANTLEAWERSGATLQRTLSAFWVAKAADTNPERDAIEEEFAPRLAAHEDAILLDSALYARLRALGARRDAGEVTLDDEAAFLLERRLLDFERGGIALDSDTQSRLRALNSEIASAQSSFEQRLVAGRNAAGVHVTDEAELAGRGDGERARLRESAAAAGLDGWLIDITNTTRQPILSSLEHRPLRERVHRASVARGLGGQHDTRELLLRLARLREERALLLGYPHHAAYVAEIGCAGTTEAVSTMLAQLATGAVARAREEEVELRARFADLEPGATFEAWDWLYVADRERQARFSLDEALLSPYLEFDRVLHRGVLAAATALYGVTFHERPELVGYVPQAQVFEVREHDGSVLGAVVIDPFTRPTKRGGAWMTSIVDQSHLLGTSPVVTNTCNIAPPAPGKPSLMSWDNVITLFHEFGHDLHGLLSDVRYPSRSGTSVPRDFVEFPSQVNEIWAYEATLLADYAVHHETGEPMPTEWVDAIRASRDFGGGFDATESLAAMLLDQAWHTTPADQLPTDPAEVEVFEETALAAAGVDLPLVPPRYRSAYFSHIFGGGYAAAYYSYIWSEIMDADTVAWFGDHGGLSREAGQQFRDGLLGRGGSLDSMEVYRDFRGADPDLSHLLERMGIAG
ncbi:MAG: M3 family metallopeptidase [Nocardioides sp.]